MEYDFELYVKIIDQYIKLKGERSKEIDKQLLLKLALQNYKSDVQKLVKTPHDTFLWEIDNFEFFVQCKDFLVSLKTTQCKWEYDEIYEDGKFKGFNNIYFTKMTVATNRSTEVQPLFVMNNYFNETIENLDDETSTFFYLFNNFLCRF